MRNTPLDTLGNKLLSVEKPARYVGGEFGVIRKPANTPFKIALSFPDLYEIGMSNFSIKILYTLLNSLEGVSCERLFAPAPDFEELLRREKLPLFSLENSLPVREFDVLAFSVGYELSATSLLNILDMGDVPLHRRDRGEGDPIVIAGGSAVSNPAPLSDFVDAVFIGEAEGEWMELTRRLRDMKNAGASREDLLATIHENPHVWYPGLNRPAVRSIWHNFGCQAFKMRFPLAGMNIVQDHGVIEIMRGCPNGCRFCHAGISYRPHREKEIDEIVAEAEYLYRTYGYREITLSSLSTGDYSRLEELVDILTRRFSSRQVSFSLPSLRVNSFTLPLLNKISEVRRSGLTFAVETPELAGQRSINKEVPASRVIEILKEAKQQGWRNAKFYFMLGLPEDTPETPAAIIDYVEEIRKATKIRIHLTVNSFIPKPHTPFQRSYQLGEDEALNKIYEIKNGLDRRFYKFGFHSPFASILEGLISRGDERVGGIIESAYRSGARLDAWEEHLDRELWRKVLATSGWDPVAFTVRPRGEDEPLPWDTVDMGVRASYLISEGKKSSAQKLTDPCSSICTHNCGICDDEHGVRTTPEAGTSRFEEAANTADLEYRRFFFSFEKLGSTRYLSHKNLVSLFQRLFTRLSIPLRYTEGFNPKPKLEFAHALSLGVESYDEIAMVFLDKSYNPNDFLERCNSSLPEGMQFTRADFLEFPKGVKSAMSYYWGSEYLLELPKNEVELVRVAKDMFQEYITTEEDNPDTLSLRLRYPEGDPSLKGIGRRLRAKAEEYPQLMKLTRLRSLFRDAPDDGGYSTGIPFPWPDSSTGPSTRD